MNKMRSEILENNIGRIVKQIPQEIFKSLLEKHSAETRELIREFLVEKLSGIDEFYEFQLVCDESNNSPLGIDKNIVNVGIYYKMCDTYKVQCINFGIQLPQCKETNCYLKTVID